MVSVMVEAPSRPDARAPVANTTTGTAATRALVLLLLLLLPIRRFHKAKSQRQFQLVIFSTSALTECCIAIYCVLLVLRSGRFVEPATKIVKVNRDDVAS